MALITRRRCAPDLPLVIRLFDPTLAAYVRATFTGRRDPEHVQRRRAALAARDAARRWARPRRRRGQEDRASAGGGGSRCGGALDCVLAGRVPDARHRHRRLRRSSSRARWGCGRSTRSFFVWTTVLTVGYGDITLHAAPDSAEARRHGADAGGGGVPGRAVRVLHQLGDAPARRGAEGARAGALEAALPLSAEVCRGAGGRVAPSAARRRERAAAAAGRRPAPARWRGRPGGPACPGRRRSGRSWRGRRARAAWSAPYAISSTAVSRRQRVDAGARRASAQAAAGHRGDQHRRARERGGQRGAVPGGDGDLARGGSRAAGRAARARRRGGGRPCGRCAPARVSASSAPAAAPPAPTMTMTRARRRHAEVAERGDQAGAVGVLGAHAAALRTAACSPRADTRTSGPRRCRPARRRPACAGW